MIEKMLDRISQKLTSGKWVLTMATALVFVVCALKGILKPEIIANIIIMVFTLYFTRKNEKNEKNEKKENNDKPS